MVKSPKLYLRDTGLLHQRLGIPSFADLSGHPMLGASWENYVIEQITAQLPDWAQLSFYRTHSGTEADLVITRGSQPETLVEITYSQAPKPSKGLFIAQEDLKVERLFIVSPVDQPFYLRNGARVLGIDQVGELFA